MLQLRFALTTLAPLYVIIAVDGRISSHRDIPPDTYMISTPSMLRNIRLDTGRRAIAALCTKLTRRLFHRNVCDGKLTPALQWTCPDS